MDEASILKDLVKFNTIKDKENVEILNYVESTLKEMGFSTWHHGKNLVMRFGDTQRLGFLGHSDTVDYIEGWHTNPFELTQKGNTLYGLGSCDMKGGIACFIQALKETDLTKLKSGIRVYITYDEEIGFGGIEELVANGEKFADYMVIGEPTANDRLTGCKGLLAFKLNTKGIKLHSSRTDKGKSANSAMIKFLYELEQFYNETIKVDRNDKFEVPYTTFNVGLINGGSGINSISDNCDGYVDFRILEEKHMDMIKAKVKELADKYEVNVITDVDIKPFDNTVDFIEEKKTANFMTEASFMEGVKRIILGPGPVTAHEVDEHVTVESLRECVEQYKEIIEKVCM